MKSTSKTNTMLCVNYISIKLINDLKETTMTSKWIKDLNIRAKTIKLLEENTEVDLHDLGFGNGFLDMTPNM